MNKRAEAWNILTQLGVPQKQTSPLCCYVLLAMAGMKEFDRWHLASNDWLRIHDILAFIREQYQISYAENSRETVRKQALHHFRNAAFIEDNGQATNSPNYRYRLTDEMLDLLRKYNSGLWEDSLSDFLNHHGTLMAQYAARRSAQKQPVTINAEQFAFSAGAHNRLQKAVLEEFLPRFVPDARCLYVGDTIEKDLVKDQNALQTLGVSITLHDKMPDIVLWSDHRQCLYLIEAVTSVGPMDAKRVLELQNLTVNVPRCVFITAFPDFATFKRFVESLAWETEVWIANIPDHMIHLNGDRFLLN